MGQYVKLFLKLSAKDKKRYEAEMAVFREKNGKQGVKSGQQSVIMICHLIGG
jgi:hypothetical protein